jgi:hypothetical protein
VNVACANRRVLQGRAIMLAMTAATLTLALWPVHVHAQTKHKLKAGDNVRIKMVGHTDEYRLESIGDDTLLVRRRSNDEMSKIPTSQVLAVQVKVPRSAGSGALRGLMIGGAIGAGAGLVYGLATWDEVNADCGRLDQLCEDTASFLKLMGSVAVFGLPAMAIGAAVGSASPGTHWQPAELTRTISVGFNANRTVFIQFSRTF